MTHDDVAKKIGTAVAAVLDASDALRTLIQERQPAFQTVEPVSTTIAAPTVFVHEDDALAAWPNDDGSIVVEVVLVGLPPQRITMTKGHARALAKRLADIA